MASGQERATYHTYHGSQREAEADASVSQEIDQSASADAERAHEGSERAATTSRRAGREVLAIDTLLHELGGTALAA